MGIENSKVAYKDLVLGEELGKGAFGVVKLAIHKVTRKQFAVKMTDVSDKNEIRRAGEEHRILQEASGHENVTKYIAFDLANQKACLVMEYCDGGNLNDSCIAQWPKEETAVKYCRQMAAGLNHLHSRQIAHSDLKPDNVLIHRGVCKISDLGVAKAFETVLGTDNYAIKVSQAFTFSNNIPVFWAPEIIERIMNSQPTAATGSKCDVFSLGLIALVLFTKETREKTSTRQKTLAPLIDGKLPYGACDQPKIDGVVNGIGAPQKVRDGIHRMLRVDPSERATAADACKMLDDLKCTIL